MNGRDEPIAQRDRPADELPPQAVVANGDERVVDAGRAHSGELRVRPNDLMSENPRAAQRRVGVDNAGNLVPRAGEDIEHDRGMAARAQDNDAHSLAASLSVDHDSGMGTMPTVSVVIPCHNYARYLPTCIESVLAQDAGSIGVEIVLIDDASTDDSWEVISRYVRAADVRAFREEVNKGYVAAYRRGMDLARGRYLVPLDADDLIVARTALSRQVELAESDARIGLVHSDTLEVDASGRPLQRRRSWERTMVVSSPAAFARLLMGNSIRHTGTLIRAAAYGQAGGYDATLANSIDWDLWLRIARHWKVGYIADPLYAYRLHEHQMHQRVMSEHREAVVREVFAVLERHSGGRPPAERARARAEALRLLAEAHFAALRRRDGLAALFAAVRTDVGITRGHRFWRTTVRGALAVALGHAGQRALKSARRMLLRRLAR